MHLLPDNFEDKFKTIFFNTDKLLKFHEELLEELDKCAHSTDLLAKCFIRRVSLKVQVQVPKHEL